MLRGSYFLGWPWSGSSVVVVNSLFTLVLLLPLFHESRELPWVGLDPEALAWLSTVCLLLSCFSRSFISLGRCHACRAFACALAVNSLFTLCLVSPVLSWASRAAMYVAGCIYGNPRGSCIGAALCTRICASTVSSRTAMDIVVCLYGSPRGYSNRFPHPKIPYSRRCFGGMSTSVTRS
jgi:hypothetical protein